MGTTQQPQRQPQARPTADDVIDLEEMTAPDGSTLFAEPQDLSTSGGQMVQWHGSEPSQLSTLPTETMAGSGWQQVAREMAAREQGESGSTIHMDPGGRPRLSENGQTRSLASRLPTDRMAATRPTIQFSDAAQVMREDPHNVEGWTPVYTSALDGWRFRLQPHKQGTTFTFLAFRSPTESNKWRIWVVDPNADALFGHTDHMISTTINGQKVPVLCGAPGARPADTLAEARVQAGKWAIYTQRRLFGERTHFSE